MIRCTLICLSILTACLKDETVSGQTVASDIWTLSTINDNPVKARITLEFPEEGRIAGEAPCNRYFATQTAPLPWFEASQIGSTKRACPDLDLENHYFTLLQEMTTAEIQDDTLILKADAGNTLVFTKP